MPDRRQNRGAHPRDRRCFAPESLATLRTATAELSWLLSRGYPDKASLVLVGDRHRLRARQRDAVQRCAVSEQARDRRRATAAAPADLAKRALLIDGYNVLLTVEAALAGAVVLRGRDGALRDLAAMSSHYRRVRQTRPALRAIGAWLAARGCAETTWYLDRPISNSARLKGWIETVAAEEGWPWRAELVADPDRLLIAARDLVATADGGILDRRDRDREWLNLAAHVVADRVPEPWLVDLS